MSLTLFLCTVHLPPLSIADYVAAHWPEAPLINPCLRNDKPWVMSLHVWCMCLYFSSFFWPPPDERSLHIKTWSRTQPPYPLQCTLYAVHHFVRLWLVNCWLPNASHNALYVLWCSLNRQYVPLYFAMHTSCWALRQIRIIKLNSKDIIR